jgi:dTDP-4-dehydrorhamnose reductase
MNHNSTSRTQNRCRCRCRVKPDIIINCAAYNLVDKAEETPDAAFANRNRPTSLAQAAARRRRFLCILGRLFDGFRGGFIPKRCLNPQNQYGKASSRGAACPGRLCRCLVSDEGCSANKQNLSSSLQVGEQRISGACDEFSVTSTDTVVEVTLRALDQGLTGRYHLTNSASVPGTMANDFKHPGNQKIHQACSMDRSTSASSRDSAWITERSPVC